MREECGLWGTGRGRLGVGSEVWGVGCGVPGVERLVREVWHRLWGVLGYHITNGILALCGLSNDLLCNVTVHY